MSEPTRRKRFRWTKVLYAAVGVYLLLTAAAWVWWDHHASAKLAELTAEIRARGEPLAWSEMAPEPLPPEQDAAVLYRRAEDATDLIAPSDPDSSFVRREPRLPRMERLSSMVRCLVSHPEFRAEHGREVRAILAEAKDALALCRRARGLRAADWGIDYDAPALDASTLNLSPLQALTNLLCLAAAAAHDDARDAEAVGHLRDALAISDSLQSCPTFIGHLVALSIHRKVVFAIEQIAPDLGGSEAGPAARTAVCDLLGDLRDEAPLRQGRLWAFIGERSTMYDTTERFRRGSLAWEHGFDSKEALAWRLLLQPMWKLDEVRLVRVLHANLLLAEARTQPEAMASPALRELERVDRTLERKHANAGPLWRFTHQLSRILTPSIRKAYVLSLRALTDRRTAAIALAIRLYELDHGRRPEALAALVPDYLPAVPDDPFAEKGTKLVCRPDRQPPALYSRSENCQDDGGAWDTEFVSDEDPDWPFFLNGDRPRGECDWEDPTTQPDKPLRWQRLRRDHLGAEDRDDAPEDAAAPGGRHDVGGD